MPATEADVLLALNPYSRLMGALQTGLAIPQSIQTTHANAIKNRYLSQSLQSQVKSAELKNNAQTITNQMLPTTLSSQNAYRQAVARRTDQLSGAGVSRYSSYTNYATGASGVIDKFTGQVYPNGIGLPTHVAAPQTPSTPVSPPQQTQTAPVASPAQTGGITGAGTSVPSALLQDPSATAIAAVPQQPVTAGNLVKSILGPMRQYSGTSSFYQKNPDQSVTVRTTPTTTSQNLTQLRQQALPYANYFFPGLTQVVSNYGGAVGTGDLAMHRDIIKAEAGDATAIQNLAQMLAIKGLSTEIGNELAKGASGSRPAMRMAFATAKNYLRFVPDLPTWEIPKKVKLLAVQLQKKYYNQAAGATEKVTQEGFATNYPAGTKISGGYIQPPKDMPTQTSALPAAAQPQQQTSVSMISPTGKPYNLSSSQVKKALSYGWKVT